MKITEKEGRKKRPHRKKEQLQTLVKEGDSEITVECDELGTIYCD